MSKLLDQKRCLGFLIVMGLAIAACDQTAQPMATSVSIATNTIVPTATSIPSTTNTPTPRQSPTGTLTSTSTLTPSRTWTPTVSDWQMTNTSVFATLTAAPTRTPTSRPTVTPTPTPLLPLNIEGAHFLVSGKPVRLTGAVLSLFFWNNPEWARFQRFRSNARLLHDWGGNFAIIEWNSGYIDDPDYLEALIDSVKYARGLGLRIELVLHSRSHPTERDNAVRIQRLNDQIKADWIKFLSKPGVAASLGESVDIINPWSEPEFNADGNDLSWDEWLPQAQDICATVRQLVRESIICAISGTGTAGWLQGPDTNPPAIPNTILEIHIYQQNYDQTQIWKSLTKKGLLVLVGEIGFDDDPTFLKNQLEGIQEYGLSFAGFSLGTDDPRNMADLNGNPTTNGKIIRSYFAELQ